MRETLEREGWFRAEGTVPRELCAALVAVLRDDLDVPVDDPDGWERYGASDIVPIWGHQAQWDIRQLPSLHALWAEIWQTEGLWVSLDMVRFTPPWREGYEDALPIHWDHDPHDGRQRWVQGVVALTDTEVGQGGWRCIPSLFHERDAWPSEPIVRPWGEEWRPDVSGRDELELPGRAGDLIVWDSRLPHANSRNVSKRPRLAFYIQMFPPQDDEERDVRIGCWRQGLCHPVWRWRPGAERAEPWPPAELSRLGRRLLGLERWPEEG